MLDTHDTLLIDSFLASCLVIGAAADLKLPDRIADHDVLKRVRLHGIAGILTDKLDAFSDTHAALRKAIENEASRLAILNASRYEVATMLAEEFAAAAVDLLFLKGARLAYSVYDKPEQRASGDIDVLVRPEQAENARSVLAQVGFVRTGGLQDGLAQEGWESRPVFGVSQQVDLHWAMTNSPALATIFPADPFALAVPLPRLTMGARGTDPVTTLINIALNEARHFHLGYVVNGECIKGVRRLGGAHDVMVLCRTFDSENWEQLKDCAASRGIARTVAEALRHSAQSLKAEVPQAVLDALNGASAASWLDEYISSSTPWRRLRYDLSAAHGFYAKRQVLSAQLFPSEVRMRVRYPDRAGASLTWLYVRRMLAAPFRWLTKRR
ncbi:nucleotidyltransferase family protein [Aurantiacibacter aquimixticola]|uniref:Nucleotidyltransferase family protein n=1 Tax=Aurantiacibacter aquimixticola TaxID=1958945 RepID=A0A419RUJ1_9SPHN|nr:nucleotidyltransferase family protein [Aurantiacibacter aquimixticola]RJY09449.1 hypothetical protein D6201_08845 [Aurantiacibacter aquimixticola]